MGIGVARLAAGLVAVNGYKSANHTVVAQLFTKQNPNMKAVVKDLTARQLANELVAASLVNKLNLPAPRSFLVFADPKDAFGSGGVAHASGQHLYFGSEFSNDKPFFTFFNYSSPLALRAICGFKNWGSILAVDEWIANVDRHLGNLLYDGSTLYLFDHDRCLTGPQWQPADLIANAIHPCHQDVNVVHTAMPAQIKRAAKNLADKLAQIATTIDVNQVISDSLAAEVKNGVSQDMPAVEQFLRDRVPIIPALCQNRLSVGGPF